MPVHKRCELLLPSASAIKGTEGRLLGAPLSVSQSQYGFSLKTFFLEKNGLNL